MINYKNKLIMIINRAVSTTGTACFLVVWLFLFVAFIFLKNTAWFPVIRWTPAYGRELSPIQSNGIITYHSHRDSDVYSINVPALFDPITSTVSILDPTLSTPPDLILKTRPYPRKVHKTAMSKVKELTITSTPPKIPCGVSHNIPALLFSAGGYTGNFFHDFNDGFVPLFTTINSFFHDRDVILGITNMGLSWAQKYGDLLPSFTRHPIIDVDNHITAHCFPSVIVGLSKHGNMLVDPTQLPHRETLRNFHGLIRSAYNARADLKPVKAGKTVIRSRRPLLVLVNRKGNVGRVILNLKRVIKEIKGVGFRVNVFEPKKNTSLAESYKLLNRTHAMIGVHGAALTHFLLMRPGSVVGEIVPMRTDWLAKTYFERPAMAIGMEYMRYKISAAESSLKNPNAYRGNWSKTHVYYLKKQNVKLDAVRFRKFLKEVFEKAKKLMEKEG